MDVQVVRLPPILLHAAHLPPSLGKVDLLVSVPLLQVGLLHPHEIALRLMAAVPHHSRDLVRLSLTRGGGLLRLALLGLGLGLGLGHGHGHGHGHGAVLLGDQGVKFPSIPKLCHPLKRLHRPLLEDHLPGLLLGRTQLQDLCTAAVTHQGLPLVPCVRPERLELLQAPRL